MSPVWNILITVLKSAVLSVSLHLLLGVDPNRWTILSKVFNHSVKKTLALWLEYVK